MKTRKEARVSSGSSAVVIPARWASTRFPGKALAQVCGKPLIHWVIRQAKEAKAPGCVIVATDDEKIQKAAEEAGAAVVMTRPDHESGSDRVAEAAAGLDVDVVINVQGDEPLIEPGLIDDLAEGMAAHGEWDMATAATACREEDVENPSVVKVVCNARGEALYFSRAPIPYVRDGRWDEDGNLYLRHIGIYAYRKEFLMKYVATPSCALERAEKLEQLRALHMGGRIAVVPAAMAGIGIDTPEDLPYVEGLLRKRIEGRK